MNAPQAYHEMSDTTLRLMQSILANRLQKLTTQWSYRQKPTKPEANAPWRKWDNFQLAQAEYDAAEAAYHRNAVPLTTDLAQILKVQAERQARALNPQQVLCVYNAHVAERVPAECIDWHTDVHINSPQAQKLYCKADKRTYTVYQVSEQSMGSILSTASTRMAATKQSAEKLPKSWGIYHADIQYWANIDRCLKGSLGDCRYTIMRFLQKLRERDYRTLAKQEAAKPRVMLACIPLEEHDLNQMRHT